MLTFLRFSLLLLLSSVAACSDRDNDRGNSSEFPNQPIRVVVPFSPGGGSDTFARSLQAAIKENDLLPSGLIIDNQPGAGGSIGSRTVKDSDADGYRILFLHDAIVTARYAGQTNYGPEAFTPIAATGEIGAVIAVGPESDFDTLASLMTTAAAEPETISFAANIGAPSHFWALLLENASPGGQARFRFVQSGGGALRFGDLKGGHVAVSAFSVAELLQFQSEGLRALAYLGEQRHPALPGVPTASEQGFAVTTGNLQSWWAPLGTPPERIAVIEAALKDAMHTDSLRQRMDELQIEPLFLGSDELHDEIAMREAAVRKVAARDLPAQPNLPKWTLIAALAVAAMSLPLRRRRQKAEAAEVEPPTSPSPTASPFAKQLIQLPWAAFALIGTTAVILALWQLESIGFRTMAALLIVITGYQLRDKVSGADLMILIGGGTALAFASHWLFTTILGVDL